MTDYIPQKPPHIPASNYQRRPNKPRPQYGKTHQELREIGLKKFPICQKCLAAWSKEAHHLIYPATRLEDYQFLCRECHRKITDGSKT